MKCFSKIIQPTHVIEHNSSLIDNIFSNNIIDDAKWYHSPDFIQTLFTICICKKTIEI